MRKTLLFGLLSLLLFTACDTGQKQVKEANARLNDIKLLIKENNLPAAKIMIDSVHLLYPRLIDIRRKAAELKDQVKVIESEKMLLHIDSVLPVRKRTLDSLKVFFTFEKDNQNRTLGVYTHRLQLAENNSQQTYLKANVFENGELSLSGIYFNKRPLECSSLKIIVNDGQTQETVQGNGATFTHQVFDEEGFVREMTSFNEPAENGICKLIAENTDLPVKVMLQGKYIYSFLLSANDKKAIKDTYHLYVTINDIIKLNQQFKKAKYIIQTLDVKK